MLTTRHRGILRRFAPQNAVLKKKGDYSIKNSPHAMLSFKAGEKSRGVIVPRGRLFEESSYHIDDLIRQTTETKILVVL